MSRQDTTQNYSVVLARKLRISVDFLLQFTLQWRGLVIGIVLFRRLRRVTTLRAKSVLKETVCSFKTLGMTQVEYTPIVEGGKIKYRDSKLKSLCFLYLI